MLDRPYVLAFVALLLLSVSAVAPARVAAQAPEYDVILRGGPVFDGTGNPWVRADVAVSDGRIAAVGPLGEAAARREIDVDGLFVMPGIIDIHSHANAGFDDEDPRARATINNLLAVGDTYRGLNQLNIGLQLEPDERPWCGCAGKVTEEPQQLRRG